MTLNKGDVFGAGVRILKKSATEALDVTDGPVSYLHFVRESDGATIVPVYEAGGFQSYAGPLSGAKITIPETDLTAVNEAIASKVSSVSGTAPIVSSGGTTPAISITAASGAAAGSMSAAHYTKLEGIEAGADVTDFANVSSSLSAASGNVSFNSNRITNVSDPSDAQDAATKAYVDSAATRSPYGTLIKELSVNATFAATETKDVHTITPTDGRVTTYRIFWRAVPATNDGTGGGFIQETSVLVRKTGGTATVSTTGTPVQQRISPLASASGSVSASSGDILIRFSTIGGAATLTQCDVYADEST